MMHEVRSIPPAPRNIRFLPLAAHRWPLFALGAFCSVAGCLLAWLMFLQSGGKPSDQRRLEQGPTATVAGRVIAVDGAAGLAREQVRYRFEWLGDTIEGASSAVANTARLDDEVRIEVLREDAHINRMVGTVLFVERAWLTPSFWLVVLAVPGVVLLLGWLAGSFQLRQVLAYGDATVGHVVAIAPVRLMVPEMLRVTYEFRDHHAELRRGTHWVLARGELGTRLARQRATGRYERMPVLHDRRLPHWSRMILPQDFLVVGNGAPLPANGKA